MRKCLLALSLLFLAWSGLVPAERVQDLPAPTNYVSDFAGVLSPETQTSLNALVCAGGPSGSRADCRGHHQVARRRTHRELRHRARRQVEGGEEGHRPRPAADIRTPMIASTASRWATALRVFCPTAGSAISAGKWCRICNKITLTRAVTLAVRQIAGVIAADAGVTLSTGVSTWLCSGAPGEAAHAR